jgi:4-amino-4-deoxy-L-arabinose transferase-like glycosyltransferase
VDQRRHNARAALLVATVALSLRVAWILAVPNAQYSDSVWYDASAAHLAATGEYGPGRASAWFPPGYPLFLAAIYTVCGPSQLAGKFANAILGAAACGLLVLVGRGFVPDRAALVGGLLAACWPNFIFHTSILSSDVLATFLFVAAAYSIDRIGPPRPIPWVRAGLLGLLVGGAVLTRPVAVTLLLFIALRIWLSGQAAARALTVTAVIAVFAALPAAGWTLRNYRRFGELIPISTNGGYNFWQSNNRYADGTDTFWTRVPPGQPEFETMRTANEFVKNRLGYRYGLAYLRGHPLHLLALAPNKVLRLYGTDTSGLYEAVLHAPLQRSASVAAWFKSHYVYAQALTFLYYIVLVSLAATALLIDLPRDAASLVLVVPALLMFGFHLFFHVKDRFHLPVVPFIALLAGVEVTRLIDQLSPVFLRPTSRGGAAGG